MFTMRELFDWPTSTEARKGVWVPCRPIPAPWRWRLRDAWAVLRGDADAFTWPEGQ